VRQTPTVRRTSDLRQAASLRHGASLRRILLLSRLLLALSLVAALGGAPLLCQSSSTSSSSSSPGSQVQDEPQNQPARARIAEVEPGDTAVTLETNEALFYLAASLNACGYDADVEHSEPVRLAIRAEMEAAAASNSAVRDARTALCHYIEQHRLAEPGRTVSQYVSLAMYLTPPPELTLSASELDIPPDSAQVVNVLPLLRTFAEAADLNAIWIHHRPDYEALLQQVHDPVAQAVLQVNLYLRQPVSSYDGRRFLVLLEPMLSPAQVNARIYANDYIIVASPSPQQKDGVRIDLLRHTYLHYVVEPLVYSRPTATERLLPLLRPVQDAPIDFQYKSDINALITECLIKAIESRLLVIDTPKPMKPRAAVRTREVLAQYDADMLVYNRETEVQRLKLVDKDMSEGWTMTGYFAEQLVQTEKDGTPLRDEIGPMIYGIDVSRELHRDQQILFVKEHQSDVMQSTAPRAPLTKIDLAEQKLLKGDKVGAAQLAEQALEDKSLDHGQAEYVMAQVDVVSGEMDKAFDGFSAVLVDTHNPRTIAWSHVYLGRLYDTMSGDHRTQALGEYKAALAVPQIGTDARAAAETGLKTPFGGPHRAAQDEDDKDFDPTGAKEKLEYKPDAPQPK
jgi:hypothetical protein